MYNNDAAISVKACEVMQYWEYMDVKDVSSLVERIKALTNLKSWCIVTHDKDVLPSGELKRPHFHCVLTFSNNKTFGSIAKGLGVAVQYVNKIKSTTKSAQLYLIHRNNPEKYQYNPSEVQANFDYVNFVDDCPIKEKRENIALRIEKGEIKEYNIFKYITIDEYSRNKRYYQSCFEYRQGKLKGMDRSMECIFITGGSGTGKTTYAKTMSSTYGYATYISSGGKNPLDNYKGEECIILDDTRSSTWSLTDFLKLTDNHTDSLVGCRYYNKSIAECKLLIVTSCKSLDEFYEQATKEDNEPRIQLFRRFKMVMKMTKDTIYIYHFDSEKGCFVLHAKALNPTSILYNPNVSKNFVDAIISKMGLEVIPDDKVSQAEYVELPPDADMPF